MSKFKPIRQFARNADACVLKRKRYVDMVKVYLYSLLGIQYYEMNDILWNEVWIVRFYTRITVKQRIFLRDLLSHDQFQPMKRLYFLVYKEIKTLA